MKLISIYSSKGGVGKTTMSILLASWLSYEKKQHVVAYDFETLESRMMGKRKSDLQALKMKNPTLLELVGDNTDFYPMGAVNSRNSGKDRKRREQEFSEAELQKIISGLRAAKASGDGYIICDFPGRYQDDEPVARIVKAGLVDLLAFPIQPEEQSIASMYWITTQLRRKNYFSPDAGKTHQELMCFWNMVSRNDKRGKQDILAGYEEVFEAMKIPCSKTRVNSVDMVKRSVSNAKFVTTTVCYPKLFMRQAFPPLPGSTEPYIEALFEEIKSRADETWVDLPVIPNS